jgi:hypothetical protein
MDDDRKNADQLLDAVLLMLAGGTDGIAGGGALLREIRDLCPGEIDIAPAGIQARRLDLRRPANELAGTGATTSQTTTSPPHRSYVA